MDPYEHCAALVRARDRDRWLADLFAPEPSRKHLLALHAFDTEIARIPEAVSEPLAGELRLQWWRDAIAGRGEAAGHPVADALLATIPACRLPHPAFDRLLEAHIFDLYDDPMPTLADLEGYLGDTVSAVFQLGAIALSPGEATGAAEASGHAGVALGLTRVIAGVPANARRGQHFLPAELLARHGVSRVEEGGPPLAAAVAELREAARGHLTAALAGLPALPAALRPAFLPLATVEPQLRRLKRLRDPLASAAPLAPWRRQWAIWRLARTLG